MSRRTSSNRTANGKQLDFLATEFAGEMPCAGGHDMYLAGIDVDIDVGGFLFRSHHVNRQLSGAGASCASVLNVASFVLGNTA